MENLIDKIIFLDVDGVLNSEDWATIAFEHRYEDSEITDMVDPYAVMKVIDICEKTGARIIISSSWRRLTYDETIDSLNRYRDFRPMLPYVIGITGIYSMAENRGQEIMYLLNDIRKHHYEHDICDVPKLFKKDIKLVSVPKYVIIDDDIDMLEHQLNYFMRTDYVHGLTDEQVEVIIDFFNGERDEILTAECNFYH